MKQYIIRLYVYPSAEVDKQDEASTKQDEDRRWHTKHANRQSRAGGWAAAGTRHASAQQRLRARRSTRRTSLLFDKPRVAS